MRKFNRDMSMTRKKIGIILIILLPVMGIGIDFGIDYARSKLMWQENYRERVSYESNPQTTERMQQLQSSVSNATVNLPSLEGLFCGDHGNVLTEVHLGLGVETFEKKINKGALLEIVKPLGAVRIDGMFIDTSSLRDDINSFQSLQISENTDEYTISFEAGQPARAYDFVTKILTDRNTYCFQKVRLHFSEPATALERSNWKIHGAIGRSGQDIGRFSLPYGTQIFQGNLWTTDCSNENVSTFSLDGQFLGSFGKFGTRLGQLDTPADLQIIDDKIYVVEERNHRVQIFSLNGEPIDVFGAFKETKNPLLFTDKLNNPLGLAYNGKHLAVVDHANQRILGISPENDYETVWVSGNLEEDEPFKWYFPYYARWSEYGQYFVVSNRSSNEIVLMGSQGKKLRSLGTKLLNRPHEVDIDQSGNIYVADTENNRVVIYHQKNDFDENSATILQFPKSYGLPKTLVISPNGFLVVGFVGNGSAYFLLLGDPEKSLSYDIFSKKFGSDVKIKLDEGSSPTSMKFSSQMTETNLQVEARKTYSQHCSSCHENGNYGAPARGNVEAWEPFPQNLNELLAMTVVGKGSMSARGGCDECSDQLLLETIKLMLPMNWSTDANSPN